MQGNMTVTQYYSKLKRLWDELSCLEPIPSCICGAAKILGESSESHKIMHFLMGLGEEYDHSKDQILLMDPLPPVSKVFSMMLKVEKQKVTQMMNTESSVITALMAKSHIFNNIGGYIGSRGAPQF